ncbi:hypothetical protein OK18_19080 [Chryseobacterium gallinarum]|uniref:Phage late control D family protein n=1 Tax=Chryseobacterium gallinarum TaxID=1324352 RepID=A0A0G3M5I5_CHRGL|nr:hypothetical protein [Chryseobacterium gallinarum]AKK74436.1 hypothetical protein OK18_19080 [Chryseobacterium gallinarum]
MAFYLTSKISIGDYNNIKPNKVSWKTDVGNFIDTCNITLPRIIHMINESNDETKDLNLPEDKKLVYQFKEGDKVSVLLGYNKKNEKRFEGFVRNVKLGIPVELECEGYGYQLYDIIFNKTYASVTVRQLLQDVTAGTDIKLSPEMPDIPLKNVRFKNATGIQVLEYLKKECQLAVYFNFSELYVGTLFGKVQKRAKIKIGWNTVKDDDFQKRKVDKNVKIVVREKDQKGEVTKTKSTLKKTEIQKEADRKRKEKERQEKALNRVMKKYDDEKEVKIKAGIPSQYVKEIVNRLQIKENYKGYEGNIQLFLVPYINKGMVLEIDGGMYPEKTGDYFVESVSGEFGMGGGRQTVQLGFIWDGNTGTVTGRV